MTPIARLLPIALLASAATVCAQDKGPPPPIVVGAVSSLTGPGASDASVQAARLVFDSINATGGIQGRRIEYRVIDDQMSPPQAQRAATALIDDPRTVALVGGSSALECGVNHARYAQAGLFNLPGAGGDPACFASTHIAPLNAGPYVATATALTFAHQVLRHERLCVVSPALPGMTEAFEKSVRDWTQRTQAPRRRWTRTSSASPWHRWCSGWRRANVRRWSTPDPVAPPSNGCWPAGPPCPKCPS